MTILGRKMVIDHLIANAELFLHKLESPRHYMSALTALDSAWPRIPSTVRGCRTYVAGKLVSGICEIGARARPFQLRSIVERA